jgi:hypothetical protein
MVVHQGLAYVPTATGGGGGAGSPWVGAVITVGLLISPVALPHLSRRLKTLMVCLYASSSLLKKKILCHLCVPGFVKPPLVDFRKKFFLSPIYVTSGIQNFLSAIFLTSVGF